MPSRLFFVCFFVTIGLHANAQLRRYAFTEPKMGSPFMIVLYCSDSLQAVYLAKQSFKLVDSFNNIFSDYLNSSELMQLNAAAGNHSSVKVSPALLNILLQSKIAYEKSEGAFDITVGPIVKLWRSARKTNQFPSAKKIDAARDLTGFNKLIIDTANKEVTLTETGMGLDLGGIAKGWIAQKVIDFLSSQKITISLADAGGDIAMSEGPPNSKGWSVGVNVPESKEDLLEQSLLIQNKSVATSGDAYQFIEHDGKRYSHITDPKTGYGVTFQHNVTVIANDGATADWLATACSILPIKKAKKLAVKMKSEVLIAENKNDHIIFYSTKGFAHYWKQ